MIGRLFAGLSALIAGVALVAAPAAHAQDTPSGFQANRPATADPADRQGVSINLGAVSVDERLKPGRSYQLPPLRVSNPGTVETAYEMSVRPNGEGLEPVADWVRFSPTSFTLPAGSEQLVEVDMVLPPGAREGRYTGLMTAQVVNLDTPAGATGAAVGAAAATRLDFEVVPASWLSGWFNFVRRVFTDNAPWSYVAVGTIATAIALFVLSRRFHLRLERVPRS